MIARLRSGGRAEEMCTHPTQGRGPLAARPDVRGADVWTIPDDPPFCAVAGGAGAIQGKKMPVALPAGAKARRSNLAAGLVLRLRAPGDVYSSAPLAGAAPGAATAE